MTSWNGINRLLFVDVVNEGVLADSGRSRSSAVSSSKHLVVMERQGGRVLWTATARSGFRHNAICIGGGRLYAGTLPLGARGGAVAPRPARLLELRQQHGGPPRPGAGRGSDGTARERALPV